MSQKLLNFLLLPISIVLCTVRMPKFSWDTVPVYIHMCNGTGPFNQSTLEYLSTFPIVTIEKGQGINANGTLPSNYSNQYEESKILEACQSIKEINDSIICIFYYNSMLDWNMYYFHILLQNNPSYWLRDDKGTVVRQTGDKSFPQPPNGMLVYDYRQQSVIDFFISECINMTKSKYIDGCFIDRANEELTASQFSQYKFNSTDKTRFKNGHDAMLAQLQKTLGDHDQSIMISNNYVTNGVIATMIEHFEANKDYIEKLIGYAKQGILVEVHAGDVTDGNDNHCKNIINSLSAFLIGAEEFSYYGCSHTNAWYIEPDWIRDHPEYHKPLGKPDGDAVLKNNVYTRTFASGTKVSFNVNTNVGTIEWSTGEISVGLYGSSV
eukprot:342373_1